MDTIASAVRKAAADLAAVPGLVGGDPSAYVPRITFELQLLVDRKGADFKLWDLGGGNGMLALAAAQLGIQATNIDDLAGLIPTGADVHVEELLTKSGVRMIRHDLSEPLDIDDGVDVVVTMHTIEHMHGSPKLQYHMAVDALAPGGLFVIAAPNAVNLRKRVSGVLGTASWSPMDSWYETPVFRSHVREPRVADLVYIARDLGLDASIIGKNFVGQTHVGWRHVAAKVLGPVLEYRPTLCSDLYLVAAKPVTGP
jgi:SAM-dependent methyltransferase